VYDKWPLLRRQLCWAHLKRDFQKLVHRGGPAARLGKKLLTLSHWVFEEWHLFRGGTIDRATLDVRLGPLAYELERLLEAGHRCADAKAAGFCANLYELRLAAWQFVVTEGLELSFWATERAASARRRGRPLSSRIAWGR
jgi:transposase